MLKRMGLAALPLALLAACGHKDDPAHDKAAGDTPDISINTADGKGGSVAIKADGKDGTVAIRGDGVSIDAKLPGIDLGDINTDFDIDGVSLYPGSKIRGLDVNAQSEGDGNDVVRFTMTAPDAPAKVAAWYAKAFAEKGVTAKQAGTTVTGTTKDGDPFTITLTPDGAGSKGVIELRG